MTIIYMLGMRATKFRRLFKEKCLRSMDGWTDKDGGSTKLWMILRQLILRHYFLNQQKWHGYPKKLWGLTQERVENSNRFLQVLFPVGPSYDLNPGWWFQTLILFSTIYGIILPIDELIFFKMVKTTNQNIFSMGITIPTDELIFFGG